MYKERRKHSLEREEEVRREKDKYTQGEEVGQDRTHCAINIAPGRKVASKGSIDRVSFELYTKRTPHFSMSVDARKRANHAPMSFTPIRKMFYDYITFRKGLLVEQTTKPSRQKLGAEVPRSISVNSTPCGLTKGLQCSIPPSLI